MTDLRAVLLDMDGTLCDTEPLWIGVELAMAKRYGAEWTQADGLAQVGNNLLDTGRYMKRRMRLDLTPEAIVDELVDGVTAAVARQRIDWRPGALDLVDACNRAGLPTGLVTMSYARFAHTVVSRMPRGRFDVVVTGDMVVRGKPEPDAYLAAADRLRVPAAACVAVEDSPGGALSAQQAGCFVIVVPHQVPVPAELGDLHVSSLSGTTVESLVGLVAAR